MDDKNFIQIHVFSRKDFTRSGVTGQQTIPAESVSDSYHNNQTSQKKIHLHLRYVEWIMPSFIIGSQIIFQNSTLAHCKRIVSPSLW